MKGTQMERGAKEEEDHGERETLNLTLTFNPEEPGGLNPWGHRGRHD